MAQNALSWDDFEDGPAAPRAPSLKQRDLETTIDARLSAQARAGDAERRAQEDQRMQRERFALDQQKRIDDRDQKEKDRAAGVGIDTKAREGESKAASFLIRALGANEKYESVGLGPRSLVGNALATATPNLLNSLPGVIGNSSKRQVADTTQDQFIAATLRQDSGAAIPEEELARQRRIYFPIPGDGPEAIEAKRRARVLALEGLKESAGRLEPKAAARYDALTKKWGGSPASAVNTPPAPAAADALAGLPDGVQAAGEDIKGYRLAGDDETKLRAYANSPGFTPEGFAGLMAGMATKAGVPVDDAYRAAAVARGQEMAAQRAKDPKLQFGGVDYSEADKAATGNASALDVAALAVKNAPESAYNLVTGAAAPLTDALRSMMEGERAGIYKTLPDLAGSLLGKAGITNADPAMANAFGDMLAERYGSVDGFKRAFATDPAGVAGDLSLVLSGGGTAAARLPGVAGRAGEMAATAGRVLDPLSLTVAAATEGPGAIARALPDVAKDAAAAAPAGLVGLPSGLGGDAVREAAGAGRSRGKAGAPTTRSDAFLQAMRDPNTTMDDVVAAAQGGVQELRDRASDKYTQAMAQFGQNPVPLNLGDIQSALINIKPKSYDTLYDAPKRPTDHIAWQNMMDSVNHYVQKAGMDPALAMPLAVDEFKQNLYSIGSKVGDVHDRDASRIAGTAYNAVKKLLTDHDPVYADVMKNYERAAKQVQQMESTFSLGGGRGKDANVDTATRKLQSIFRNNAQNNYGQRLALGEELGDLDPSGTLMPLLAGQTAASWRPRSLMGNVGGAGIGAASVFGGIPPAAVAAVPAISPRVIGELAYGAGRGYGTAERALGPALSAGKSKLDDLYTRYQDSPAAFLAASQANNASDDLERKRQEDLLRRYSMTLPGVDPGFARGGRVSVADLAKRYGC